MPSPVSQRSLFSLNVFPLALPPFARTHEDIPLLVEAFVHRHVRRLKKPVLTVPDDVMSALVRYPWPGNVRELANCIERAGAAVARLRVRVPLADFKTAATLDANEIVSLEDTQREQILAVLRQTNWVIGGPAGGAARFGMKRTTLQSEM